MEVVKLTVTQLIQQIKELLETHFEQIVVEGEAQNITCSYSGHYYFNLLDKESSISVALFKGDALRNPLVKKIKDGDRLILLGPINVYPKKGQFQLIAKRVWLSGQGDLKAKFEELKKKLSQEGLFDLSHKKKLPDLPEKIGVITSPQGAAFYDFIKVIKRRTRFADVVIIPALVQGEFAPESIRSALKKAITYNQFDVIVLTRGGGSTEDLWCFNDEDLVRDLFNCPIPIVSAVGHEVDFTLCDYVADVRAETPTAAAELLSNTQIKECDKFNFLTYRLKQIIQLIIARSENSLKKLSPLSQLQTIWDRFYSQKKTVDRFKEIVDKKFSIELLQKEQFLDDLFLRLDQAIQYRIQLQNQKLQKIEGVLSAIDPQKVLSRGYSFVQDQNGKIVSTLASYNRYKEETLLDLRFWDGKAKIKVHKPK